MALVLMFQKTLEAQWGPPGGPGKYINYLQLYGHLHFTTLWTLLLTRYRELKKN